VAFQVAAELKPGRTGAGRTCSASTWPTATRWPPSTGCSGRLGERSPPRHRSRRGRSWPKTLLTAGRPADAPVRSPGGPHHLRPANSASRRARAAAAAGDDRSRRRVPRRPGQPPPPHPARALLLRSEICRRQGRTSYGPTTLAARAARRRPGRLARPAGRLGAVGGISAGAGGWTRPPGCCGRGSRPRPRSCSGPLAARPDKADALVFVGLAEARQLQGDRQGGLGPRWTGRCKWNPKNLGANYQRGLLLFASGEQLWAGRPGRRRPGPPSAGRHRLAGQGPGHPPGLRQGAFCSRGRPLHRFPRPAGGGGWSCSAASCSSALR